MCHVLGVGRGAGYVSCIGSRERCRVCVMYWELGEVQGMCRVLGIRRGAGYESCTGSRERCRICVMYWEYGEVQGMCRVLGIGRVAQRVLEVKPERKRTFVKPKRR